jgi:hypothetical protein
MSFEEYLVGKKIDSAALKAAEPVRWKEWQELFSQVSEQSFTAQKLYLINPVRRKYPLKVSEPSALHPADPPKPGRPVIRPKAP